MSAAAILLAGGSATRLGSGENKVYLQLGGIPMLAWSLQAFEDSALIDDIVLVVREADRGIAEEIAASLGLTKLRATVTGGDTRHDSERAGLESLATSIDSGETDLVAIHDAARPFVSAELLARLLEAAAERGGAAPALPVGAPFLVRTTRASTDATTRASTDATTRASTDATALRTDDLRRMQTPQAFHATGLLAAYRAATAACSHGVDTAETVERFGDLTVVAVAGDPDNHKVTFADDLRTAEARAATWPERPDTAPGRPGAA